LGGGGEEPAEEPAATPDYEAPPAAPALEDRVTRLEAQLEELRGQVDELRR